MADSHGAQIARQVFLWFIGNDFRGHRRLFVTGVDQPIGDAQVFAAFTDSKNIGIRCPHLVIDQNASAHQDTGFSSQFQVRRDTGTEQYGIAVNRLAVPGDDPGDMLKTLHRAHT